MANSVYEGNYSFMMDIIEKMFDIRSCTEILVNGIKNYTVYQYMKAFMLGDLHLHKMCC